MKQILFASLMGLALALPACKPNNGENGTSGDNPDTVKYDVQTFVSTADNTMHFDKIGKNFGEGLNMSVDVPTVSLRPSVRYQEFDGFGIALNGSACYNLMQMSAEARHKILEETYDVEKGMGYSYARISIGCSDFSLSEYTNWDDREAGFALTSEELNYVIPVLKEVLAINPSIHIMGSPWTCPRWMKVDNISTKKPYMGWTGGHLNPDCYSDYADLFVQWVQAFEAAGVPIDAVTIQNEPLNPGNSASLVMGWTECRDFVKVLGPKFEAANIHTKIIVFDHNYNYDNKADQQQYPLNIYKDAEASRYIDGAAYHNYGGNCNELNTIHNAAEDKNLYFTEASIGTWNCWDYGQSFKDIAENVCMNTALRWCKCALMWNYMLAVDNSIQGEAPARPGGCETCYGAVQVDPSKGYNVTLKRGAYYTMGHMSKALRSGSTRIGLSTLPNNVMAVASENLDGTYGLVLYNKNTSVVKLVVDDGTHHFDLTLPGESMTSCVWKK